MCLAEPVNPNTPKWIMEPPLLTSRNEIFSHVGEDTETKTRRTQAAKQKKRPGIAGEAAIAAFGLGSAGGERGSATGCRVYSKECVCTLAHKQIQHGIEATY